MSAALNEFDTLKRMVAEAEDDVRKADGGNKAAGTRVRKKMQEIKQAAQQVRVKILESRGGEGEGDADTASQQPSAGDA